MPMPCPPSAMAMTASPLLETKRGRSLTSNMRPPSRNCHESPAVRAVSERQSCAASSRGWRGVPRFFR